MLFGVLWEWVWFRMFREAGYSSPGWLTVLMLVPFTVVPTLAGCAIPTTGVAPRGEGMYTVTRQGSGAWVTVDSLKAQGLQEADAFCSAKGENSNSSIARKFQRARLGAGQRAKSCSDASRAPEGRIQFAGDRPIAIASSDARVDCHVAVFADDFALGSL
jgi:hypothetical protein